MARCFKAMFCFCCNKKKGEDKKKKTEYSKAQDEAKNIQEEQKKNDEMLKMALRFFKKNVARIDIVRERNLEKIYFPVMPFCKY